MPRPHTRPARQRGIMSLHSGQPQTANDNRRTGRLSCATCGGQVPARFGGSFVSYVVMEATIVLLFLAVIILEASVITSVVAAVLLSHAWLFWFTFGPVRCPGCGIRQRPRMP